MPIFTKDDRSVLFVHVPKTGGTSLERLMIRAGWSMGLHATPTTEPREHFRLRRCSPQHYHGALLAELLHLRRFELSFLLVRDPIARFRSEYAYRSGDADAGRAAAVNAWAKESFDRLPVSPFLRDNHLRPQHEFLVPGAHVYRLEDGLEAIADHLNAEFDLGIERSIRRFKHSGEDHALASRDVEVDAALEARLRKVYAEDFALFGYDAGRASRRPRLIRQAAPQVVTQVVPHTLHRLG